MTQEKDEKKRKDYRSTPIIRRSIRSRAPSAASPKVREIMQGLTGVETRPEKMLRSRLHRLGLRFRKNCRPLPELKISADVVFPRQKVCVFVDGCFWHGCSVHFRAPRSNTAWWREKIADNRTRDNRQNQTLSKHGWLVLRYWEHNLVGQRVDTVFGEIARSVRGRQRGLDSEDRKA